MPINTGSICTCWGFLLRVADHIGYRINRGWTPRQIENVAKLRAGVLLARQLNAPRG